VTDGGTLPINSQLGHLIPPHDTEHAGTRKIAGPVVIDRMCKPAVLTF
jgi:hypothetical protein